MRPYLLSITTLLAVARSAAAIATTGTPVFMGLRNPLAISMSVPKSQLLEDAVMKKFGKKGAGVQKRREDAKTKLYEYETTLERLRSKKAEYTAGKQLAEPPVGGNFSETVWRSVVKAFCWRLFAGSITFATTLQFLGSVTQAVQVVGADFFSKAFTMFIGERLMNKSQAGRQKGGDNARRSLVKALIWPIFAISNTLVMAISISKDLSIASKIASTDAVFNMALMFAYERFWAGVVWGKDSLIEFDLDVQGRALRVPVFHMAHATSS